MSTINGVALTTLAVSPDGAAVAINVTDDEGVPGSLVLSTDALRSLIMSLPRAMQQALQLRYRDPSLRLVYPLGPWRLEASTDPERLLLTLSTTDGFEVTFSVPADTLGRFADAAARAGEARKPPSH
jgi:hypothetical protein